MDKTKLSIREKSKSTNLYVFQRFVWGRQVSSYKTFMLRGISIKDWIKLVFRVSQDLTVNVSQNVWTCTFCSCSRNWCNFSTLTTLKIDTEITIATIFKVLWLHISKHLVIYFDEFKHAQCTYLTTSCRHVGYIMWVYWNMCLTFCFIRSHFPSAEADNF